MKNHIKNYIKIMGLAAVLFGTAQATDYEISVTQEYKCDPNDPKSEKDGAMHFRISVKGFDNRFRGHSLQTVEIVWPVKQNHPNPIRVPGLVMQGIMQREKGDEEWGANGIELPKNLQAILFRAQESYLPAWNILSDYFIEGNEEAAKDKAKYFVSDNEDSMPNIDL